MHFVSVMHAATVAGQSPRTLDALGCQALAAVEACSVRRAAEPGPAPNEFTCVHGSRIKVFCGVLLARLDNDRLHQKTYWRFSLIAIVVLHFPLFEHGRCIVIG